MKGPFLQGKSLLSAVEIIAVFVPL